MNPIKDSLHPWDISPSTARQIQESLRNQVISKDQFGKITTVAGVDVGFPDKGATTRAAIAVLAYPELQLLQPRFLS